MVRYSKQLLGIDQDEKLLPLMALTPFRASLKRVVGEKLGTRLFVGELDGWDGDRA